ncbi:MAG: cytochrome b/b6 domain-containing protein [Nitrospirae bacterium]|nr:cytochrome b/b6 domain-containing protein [Nitrospirota bacterium]
MGFTMNKQYLDIKRHGLWVRLSHWLNVVSLFILVMSGFQIFNAHPHLYWGDRSDRDQAFFSIQSETTEENKIKGELAILGHSFDTTGFLGASTRSDGEVTRIAFPGWITIPGVQWLAMARRWHLFFAWFFVLNGILFFLYSFCFGHFLKDLFPTWKEFGRIRKSLIDHVLFRHPKGEETARYNILQKIAYLGVLFILAPLIILTGMAMSPRIDAIAPWLTVLFGGRQSARSFHFISCFLFIGFFFIHIFMVFTTGVFNNLRSMITGRYRIQVK